MATVGVIGLGAMGNPISRHLLSKNHQVTVYDVKEELARALESKGARVARDPAEVGEKSELNLVIVIDDAQVKEVCLGPKGIVEKAKEGAVIAIMSTVSPEVSAARSTPRTRAGSAPRAWRFPSTCTTRTALPIR